MNVRVTVSALGLVLVAGALVCPAAAQAQGIAIGPRITFVRGADSPEGSTRLTGGAVRLGSGKAALEVAMDFRSGVTGDLTERIKSYPITGSLLVFPVRSKIAPYLLGGIGWYTQHVERLGPVLEDQTTRKMGYHAGFGGELRLHKHFGFYGDYRYTHIRFGDQESTVPPGAADQRPTTSSLPGWIPFGDRLKMSHQGSMFAWGANFYF